jgi:hypothetical protein
MNRENPKEMSTTGGIMALLSALGKGHEGPMGVTGGALGGYGLGRAGAHAVREDRKLDTPDKFVLGGQAAGLASFGAGAGSNALAKILKMNPSLLRKIAGAGLLGSGGAMAGGSLAGLVKDVRGTYGED